MTDERYRIPQDEVYFQAVGLAAVAFARLEWDAVWCCERLKPGYITTVERRKKTAGVIAEDLKKLFLRISNSNLRAKLTPIAVEFKEIVQERNGLLHGKPGTASNGDQRLFRGASEWTIAKVNEFSDRCARADLSLNALLYGELGPA